MAKKKSSVLTDQPQADHLDSPGLFINRELSMLDFQRRVLEEAQDPRNSLLERVKFLSFVGLNLDEFFMVRVAGLKKQVDAGVYETPPDGMTPAEQLAAVRKSCQQIMNAARGCLMSDLIPALKKKGINILNYSELTERQKATVKAYYNDVIFPVLTPLAFDPGHPFPHISNLSLNLAVLIRDKKNRDHFARIKVPPTLPRLVPVRHPGNAARKNGSSRSKLYFVWLEQVIAHHLDALFPGMQVIESHPFRVTRDADMAIQELEAADLLESMEQTVRQRRFGSVVRLTLNASMPARIREILIENLEVDRKDVYTVEGPLGISNLMGLYGTDRMDLKAMPFKPAIPPALRVDEETDIFETICRGDILIHHPYDSFIPVVNFLRTAARDPDVLAIKMTLYRVGKKPPVVDALLEAAENGKQVAVLVELKARFDEESNITWAKTLERAGVHVVYGLLGLKTHSKVVLVVRQEGEGIRRYLHMATGNYNAVTAQSYEDIGIFTCDDELGADATDLFNYLTGYSSVDEYRKLLVAPVNLRSKLEVLIQREIEHQKTSGNGYLILKINSLVDKRMIQLLYKASQAGVKIELFIRGICCLRPGLPGISENIRVTSIVGRFLEHSRIYYFRNGGFEEIYLGSADLMPRNIDRRVEVLFPVEDPKIVGQIRDQILAYYLQDNASARIMQPDGSYRRAVPLDGAAPLSIQDWLLKQRQTPVFPRPGKPVRAG